ncbi:acyl-CoA carboxylase subunit beta [Streptomyces sp. B1866]|uniref:acyl-CoA carboxylase subunit beta n=1 Tax=Streptomyces sp. B1866 TaxID=3075431 RepID=UPI002891F537|nr:acyl-CoA carboxylase subunit beta [Streptomyces sp. B1866]MDT3400699.1 acyl-CoA carboxylase subunit beta [Streptomyces sp. B1866]
MRRRAAEPGSPRAARRRRALGKLTARERVELLLDDGSFLETDPLARRRATAAGAADGGRPLGDGVITGTGTVDGRQVCVYAQDATAAHGSVGEVFGVKVGKLLDLALRVGCPVVGMIDSSGARLEEGVPALSAYGRVATRVVNASGMIPQISVVMGVCAGGAVYTPAATDFVVMVDRTSHMFVTGPDVIRSATGESVGLEALGGAGVHATRTGSAHYAADDEEDAVAFVRDLLSFLPDNNLTEPPSLPADGRLTVTARDAELDAVVPDADGRPYDMREVLARVVDDGEVLEVHQEFARNVLCGFARVDGRVVGVVASQPLHLAGALDADASEKAARFVRFLDAFGLPIVTFVDVPGFLPGTAQEHGGIIRRGAKLGFAYIEATVPKVTVITRRAFGGGYAVMASRDLGADLCFAWPTAQIGVMGARGGVDLLHHRELAAAEDADALRRSLADAYEQRLTSPYAAAERGVLDDVIAPAETRVTLVKALRALRNKRVAPLPKKHGNIPL